MRKIGLSALAFTTVLALSSCSNTSNNQENAAAQEASAHDHDHNHDGHDHVGHDHSAHAHTEESATAQTVQQAQPAASIPLFKFYKVKSGVSFTNEDIPNNKKTAFILFDPGCSHCQHEAAAIGQNYSKIKNVNIYFVSMNDPALMANFLETFAKDLVGKPNVEVLYDRNQEFIQKFHVPSQFPANYVYGADNKFQTFWEGDKKIDDIIAAYNK